MLGTEALRHPEALQRRFEIYGLSINDDHSADIFQKFCGEDPCIHTISFRVAMISRSAILHISVKYKVDTKSVPIKIR